MIAAERAYAARDVCRLAGCAYRTLDYWCRANVLRPSIQEAAGKGSDRLFGATDARCLMLLVAARRFGLEIAVAVRFCDALRANPDLGAGDLLVLRDGAVVALRLDGALADVLGGGVTFVASVPTLEGEVDAE